jgi:hypothetical protein
MTRAFVKFLVLIAGLSALPLLAGLAGCVSGRYNQSPNFRTHEDHPVEYVHDEATDQSIEDGRTAERAREALAAGGDYRYDGVKVVARNGVVQLNGFVNTTAQRTGAGTIVRKVMGVRSVRNNLTVKD